MLGCASTFRPAFVVLRKMIAWWRSIREVMSQVSKYTQFDASPHSTHSMVVGLVPANARVLEFGCATGFMSEVLKNRLGCRVTGIEYSAEAGEFARQHCEQVIIGDAETLNFEQLFSDERLDIILFADVLEHLR